jgi:hypothetical protein
MPVVVAGCGSNNCATEPDSASSAGFAIAVSRNLADCAKIAGLVAFYNEQVDLIVDDVPQERPSNLKTTNERTFASKHYPFNPPVISKKITITVK